MAIVGDIELDIFFDLVEEVDTLAGYEVETESVVESAALGSADLLDKIGIKDLHTHNLKCILVHLNLLT